MKSSGYIYSGAVGSYKKNSVKQKKDFSAEFSQALDTVEIYSDGINRLSEDKNVRMDKILYIKEKINSGKYNVDISAVASNILSDFGVY